MTEFEEEIRKVIGPAANFAFGDKGKRISRLLEEKGIQLPRDLIKWDCIQWSCWLADSGAFVGSKYVQTYGRIVKEVRIEAQVKAIEKLRLLIKEFPLLAHPAVKKVFESHPHQNKKSRNVLVFDQMLAEYADELQREYAKISRKDPLEKPEIIPYGGLLFPSDLPFGRSVARKGDIKKQSLLFHLAFHFRNITSNDYEPLESPDGTMPTVGNRCWALVAEIAQIVLEEDIDEDSVKKIVGRLVQKNVMYFDPFCAIY